MIAIYKCSQCKVSCYLINWSGKYSISDGTKERILPDKMECQFANIEWKKVYPKGD